MKSCPGWWKALKVITAKASTRIAKFAFEYARKNQRKGIDCIHKANIMKLSDGLFLRCARDVAKSYPEITYGEHIVDNTCMHGMNPYQYDMLVMENLYGDILSDLCAAFVGGLGLFRRAATSAMMCSVRGGARHPRQTLREKSGLTLRHSWVQRSLWVRHLGEQAAWMRLERSRTSLSSSEKLTRDIGGKAGTSEFADAVIEEMQSAKA